MTEPESAEHLVALGNRLMGRGQLQEAAEQYRQALRLQPESAQIECNLGSALRALGRAELAVECYRRALLLRPDLAEIHNNLGNALQQMGRLDEAVDAYRAAIGLRPDFAAAHNNLGKAYDDRGEMEEAIACYQRAVELAPESARIHSNLVYAMQFHPESSAALLQQEERQWHLRHAAPLAQFWKPHENLGEPERRLRVGYLSPDFRMHPVGRFLLPLLKGHDRGRFEIHCYASQVQGDEMTQQLRGCADVWRDVFELGDKSLAEQIRADGIDVLVDLTLHMAGNRLLVFARRPAPVQITWLAYCGSSGMEAMDYRLTTQTLDPDEEKNRFYSERSITLSKSWWCYEAGADAPAVSALPALVGVVTFGCLNNFCKVNESVMEVWGRILQTVEGSRLMHYCPAGAARERVWRFFEEKGIARGRIVFADFVPLAEYFELYQRIDIGLDPFPYGGGTTTCDALWMGVPVVSLAGQRAVSRSGREILQQVGLGELAVDSADEYVRAAVELAGELPRLEEIRTSLRERMRNSTLCDRAGFALEMEAVYRRVWREWCARR